MGDVLGWRKKFAVLGPSTNTIVQPDFDDLRPSGVTNHYSRIFTPNTQAISNETFMSGARLIGQNTLEAVRTVMTASPDYIVLGMSAVTFFDGVAGADRFRDTVEEASGGLKVSCGSHACAAALRAYGGIKRIAFFSPYFPASNAEVRRYFGECGFEVVRDRCLQCPSWIAIAEVTTETCRQVIRELDGDDVDAIIQVGTNLAMARLAGIAEFWLDKPVLAINTCIYWWSLRENGIDDKIEGFGSLLLEH
jgi:maleate isomerase